MLIISAGFDAHSADPLADLKVATEDFGWLTSEMLRTVIKIPTCRGRVVSVLEGGYDLKALSACVVEHVRALLEGPFESAADALAPGEQGPGAPPAGA